MLALAAADIDCEVTSSDVRTTTIWAENHTYRQTDLRFTLAGVAFHAFAQERLAEVAA